jgi:hypothetical protein
MINSQINPLMNSNGKWNLYSFFAIRTGIYHSGQTLGVDERCIMITRIMTRKIGG